MMRNSLAVTLALFAAGAIAAAPAPSASANYNLASATGGTISGSQVGANEFLTDAGFVKCTTATFGASQATETAETLTVLPTYAGCTLSSFSATVTTSKCHYQYTKPTATDELKSPVTAHAVVNVKCPTAGTNAFILIKDNVGLGCEIKVAEQETKGVAEMTNEEAGTVLFGGVEGIAYSWTAGCPGAGGKAGSNTNGKYFGNIRFAGKNSGGTAVKFFVTGVKPPPPPYDSEVSVTPLSGTQSEPIVLATDVGVVKCAAASFTGTQSGAVNESGSFSAKTVTLTPAFSTCTLAGQSVTIATAGCNVQVAEAVKQKAATSISCESGKAITIKDTEALGCEVKVGTQSPSGRVSFTNAGAGTGRTVTWNLELTNVSYSWTSGCPNAEGKAGSSSNGAYTGAETIKGFQAELARAGVWTTASGPASYDSELATATLSGAQVATNELVTDVGTLKCTSATFSGSQAGAEKESGVFSSETVVLHPTSSGCTFAGVKVTVTTTGCDYKLAATSGSKAATSIVCEAGKAVTIKDTSGLGCEVIVGGQAPAGQVSLTNAGAGKERNFSWSSEVTGIAYSWTAGCPNAGGKAGSNTDGKVNGSVRVNGFDPEPKQAGIWVT
jgi:hypothetical protein